MKYATTIKNAERIIERYKNNEAVKIIAYEENVSISSVCRLAQAAGLPKRNNTERLAANGVPCPHCGHTFSRVLERKRAFRRRQCTKKGCERKFSTHEGYATPVRTGRRKANDQSLHRIET